MQGIIDKTLCWDIGVDFARKYLYEQMIAQKKLYNLPQHGRTFFPPCLRTLEKLNCGYANDKGLSGQLRI